MASRTAARTLSRRTRLRAPAAVATRRREGPAPRCTPNRPSGPVRAMAIARPAERSDTISPPAGRPLGSATEPATVTAAGQRTVAAGACRRPRTIHARTREGEEGPAGPVGAGGEPPPGP